MTEKDLDLAWKVWEKTQQDIPLGRAGAAQRLDSIDLNQVLLCHRFGIWELRDDGHKVRCIDNFFANGVNEFAFMP